jgi:hypothetical protein
MSEGTRARAGIVIVVLGLFACTGPDVPAGDTGTDDGAALEQPERELSRDLKDPFHRQPTPNKPRISPDLKDPFAPEGAPPAKPDDGSARPSPDLKDPSASSREQAPAQPKPSEPERHPDLKDPFNPE